MRDETFGPTLPVMAVADAEEAIALANDCRYGLAASVFTRDRTRGQQVARRLNSGVVWVHDVNISMGAREVPFGGVRDSGLGARHGPDGIRKFTLAQTITNNLVPLRRDLGWLPTGRRSTWSLDRALAVFYGR